MGLALKKRPQLREDDFAALLDEVRDLKRDVAAFARRLQPTLIDTTWGATNRFADRLGLSDRASALYRDAARQGATTYRFLNRQFRQQPAASVLIAFGIGLLISRMMNARRG